MTYEQALAIKVGQTLLRKDQKYKMIQVLSMRVKPKDHQVFFVSSDGVFSRDMVEPPKSMEEIISRFIQDPDTRVFVHYNNETGHWCYSVVVADSDGFWLNSFETEKEANEYISQNHLKILEN